MSGVWMFRNNGVIQLVENPTMDTQGSTKGGTRKKALVYLGTGDVISSYASLEKILIGLGWERYYRGSDPNLIQYHNQSSIDLISLPKNFSKFNSVHMYDIVVKNTNIFHVRDV